MPLCARACCLLQQLVNLDADFISGGHVFSYDTSFSSLTKHGATQCLARRNQSHIMVAKEKPIIYWLLNIPQLSPEVLHLKT